MAEDKKEEESAPRTSHQSPAKVAPSKPLQEDGSSAPWLRAPGPTILAIGLPTRQHPQHVQQSVLLVAIEANAPVSHPKPVFWRLEVNEAHHVTGSIQCELLDRVYNAAPHRRVKFLQISLRTR